jgi:hypothetical protein
MKPRPFKNMSLYFSIIIIILIVIFLIYLYAYNSGSCKINKKYICNNNFCLFKEFYLELPNNIEKDIDNIQKNKNLQKRVEINFYPEMIFNCAIPNKSGITISTQNIQKHFPNLINYYENELCNIISNKINLKLFPTDLRFPTSCAILIYDKEGDWINWHYDYNYYNGRFFTVLIPITNEITCTEFQLLDDNNNIKSINLTNNNCICFEGNYLYHRASKLCNNQRRVILSCQYVTDNNMSLLNKMRINLKDFAYTGKLLN